MPLPCGSDDDDDDVCARARASSGHRRNQRTGSDMFFWGCCFYRKNKDGEVQRGCGFFRWAPHPLEDGIPQDFYTTLRALREHALSLRRSTAPALPPSSSSTTSPAVSARPLQAPESRRSSAVRTLILILFSHFPFL
jgi:hypothetical protein